MIGLIANFVTGYIFYKLPMLRIFAWEFNLALKKSADFRSATAAKRMLSPAGHGDAPATPQTGLGGLITTERVFHFTARACRTAGQRRSFINLNRNCSTMSR